MTDLFGISPLGLVLFCGAVLLAAVLRGFSGFGFALAAVPMISMVVDPAKAVAIAIVVQAVVGVRDVVQMRAVLDAPGLKRLSLGALLGTPIGLLGLVYLDAATIRMVIAAIVIIGVLFLLRRVQPDMPANLRLAAPTGLLAGLFGGLAAMPGPPAVAYYLSGSTPANVSRASLMVFFFITSVMALPGLALGNLLDLQVLWLSLLAIPIMLGGTHLGGFIFARAPSTAYKPVALVSLIAMALSSGLRGLLDVIG